MSAGNLIPKLLRLAFDPSAAEGEAVNALTMAVRQARRDGLVFGDVVAMISPDRQLPPPAARATEPASLRVRMPFGKHKGLTLGEIAERDLPYLRWAINNIDRRPDLTEAMRAVQRWYSGDGRR